MLDRRKIFQVFLILYIFLYMCGQALGNKVIIAASIVTSLIAICFYPPQRVKTIFYTLIFLACLILILLINRSYPFERLVFNVAFIFSNVVLAFVLARDHKVIPIVLRTVITGIFIFILICFIIALHNHTYIYVYMDSLLKGFSYNYISGLLILALTLYFAYHAKFKLQVKYGKVLVFSGLIACVLLYGRSGIIFSFLLFAFYFKNYLDPAKGIRFYFILACLLLFAIYSSYNFSLFLEALQNSKFKEGIQSPRFVMLHEYFGAINIKTLMIGVDITQLPTIAHFNFNPHNSVINLHAMMGIFAYIVVVLIILKLFNLSFLNFSLMFYLSLYFLRGLLDTIIFPGIFDFIFLFLLFYKHQNCFGTNTFKDQKC